MTDTDADSALLWAIRDHDAARRDLERIEADLPTAGPDAHEWLGALALRAAARERAQTAAINLDLVARAAGDAVLRQRIGLDAP